MPYLGRMYAVYINTAYIRGIFVE